MASNSAPTSDARFVSGFIEGVYGLLAAMHSSEFGELGERVDATEHLPVRCALCEGAIGDDTLALVDAPLESHFADASAVTLHDARRYAAHVACARIGTLRLEKRIDLIMLERSAREFAGEGFAANVTSAFESRYPWMVR